MKLKVDKKKMNELSKGKLITFKGIPIKKKMMWKK